VGMPLRMGRGQVGNKRGDPWCRRPAKVREETNHSRFSSLHLLPLLPTNIEMCQDMRRLLTYPTHGSLITPTSSQPQHSCWSPLLNPPIRLHANADTRSRGSSTGMSCNEVAGGPHYWLPRTNVSIYGPGQRKVGPTWARMQQWHRVAHPHPPKMLSRANLGGFNHGQHPMSTLLASTNTNTTIRLSNNASTC